jgi:tight adherence protein B
VTPGMSAALSAAVTAGAAVAAAVVLLWWRPMAPGRPGPGWWPALVLVPVALAVPQVVPPALLAAGALVAAGGRRLHHARRRQREAAATAGLVLEACELLAAEVGSGQPPDAALDHAARVWLPLGHAAEAACLGGDVPAALRSLAARPGAGQLRLVAAAWEVVHRSGGGLADALARVSVALRADRATLQVVEGELASARATARLVAALPAFALLLSAGAGGGAWSFLTGTPPGWACLLGGLALGLAGLAWIERIAQGVLR